MFWLAFFAVLVLELASAFRDRARPVRVRIAFAVAYLAIAAWALYSSVTVRHVDDGRDDIHILIKGSP